MTTEFLILAHKMLGHFAIVITGAGLFTAIDFSHTITLGSVLLAVLVVVVSGIFTIRSRIANIWRIEAEGQRARADRLEEELAAAKLERLEFEKKQQEIRHDLKGELAQCKAELKVMEAKTDLTAALDAIHHMQQQTVSDISSAITQVFVERSAQEHSKTHQLLAEIRDKLPSEPIEIVVPGITPNPAT